jgi:hypothetical protein
MWEPFSGHSEIMKIGGAFVNAHGVHGGPDVSLYAQGDQEVGESSSCSQGGHADRGVVRERTGSSWRSGRYLYTHREIEEAGGHL